MSIQQPNLSIPVDLMNPGQFFACCGLLELANRLWPGSEGWFERDRFLVSSAEGCTLRTLLEKLARSQVDNTMTPAQKTRLEELSYRKKQGKFPSDLDGEKKTLESMQRGLPILLKGEIDFRIDWFCDDLAGGSRFKTWAGQQSVLTITQAMHGGLAGLLDQFDLPLWRRARKIGLPFNFDSDLGGEGSALDIGFSFDPLAGSEATRIEGTSKPGLELLCFIGLQRFRPQEIPRANRFIYTAWSTPLLPVAAAAMACGSVQRAEDPRYEFKLLYRTKYLKSFLPAIPYRGD